MHLCGLSAAECSAFSDDAKWRGVCLSAGGYPEPPSPGMSQVPAANLRPRQPESLIGTCPSMALPEAGSPQRFKPGGA
ncbi:hypothetical protein SKAU_G00269580 [Synaphobranchus kaupii]|uniref:Uncharacterized protein n=1 Tax=Synaphobranchus kaupii TaxID=118154 RepID=A0A9Q1EZY0_SYNKA|nr:hypothetical protein SKAU_G00269580 [Synaphobranchus kaupii]